MGSTNKNNTGEQIMHYGARCGRCKLQSVKIVNKGINWSSANNVYWKHDVERSESVKIILHENAEFEAKDVVLKGNHIFEVPTGHRMRIVQDGPGLLITCPIFLLSLVPFCEKATTLTYFSTKITCDVKRVVHNASVFLLEVYYSINYLC
jgi:hypothetical protein